MNYYCVRRELLMNSRAQTSRQDEDTSTPYRVRPRRFYSEPTENNDGAGVGMSQCSPLNRGNNFNGSGTKDECQAHRFDFYLAVAEEDLKEFGIPFSNLVERRMSMRPCLTIRDVPVSAKFEAMAETLETKCGGKVVFVVSKNFPGSDECQFLVQFAKTLDPDAMCAKLIPLVIDKNVPLPRVLQGLSSINYNAAVRENWLGRRLWEAIHGTHGWEQNPRITSLSSSLP